MPLVPPVTMATRPVRSNRFFGFISSRPCSESVRGARHGSLIAEVGVFEGLGAEIARGTRPHHAAAMDERDRIGDVDEAVRALPHQQDRGTTLFELCEQVANE